MTVEGHLIACAQRDVSDGPTDLMQLCLFDWLVCAIAGADESVAAVMRAQSDANGASQIIGGGNDRPAQVALINGTIGHALDYDDTHFGHIGHTSAAVMPAVLALGQMLGRDTSSLLEAALVGSEAAVRTGLWLGRDHYQIGYHQTATSGAFGATVAAARLLGLDTTQTGHAIGLAATAASGLKGQFGTMGKPLNAGLAARCGVEAALWAAGGMTADPAGLSGPLGFGVTHHGMNDQSAWEDPQAWQISTISHKFHACCHGLHAMLEALATVDLDTAAIARISVATHPRWLTVCNQATPDTGLGVKFSYAMTAAMALSGVDTAQVGNFSDATAHDPALIALRDLVRVTGEESLSEMQARVKVTLQDGHIIDLFHDLNAPLSLYARETRLRAKVVSVLGARPAASIWDAVASPQPAAIWQMMRGAVLV